MPERVRVRRANGHGKVSVDLDECTYYDVNVSLCRNDNDLLETLVYYHTNDNKWICMYYQDAEEKGIVPIYCFVHEVVAAHDFHRYRHYIPLPPELEPHLAIAGDPERFEEWRRMRWHEASTPLAPDTNQLDWIVASRRKLNRALDKSEKYPRYLERLQKLGEIDLERRGPKFAIRFTRDTKRHKKVESEIAKLSMKQEPR